MDCGDRAGDLATDKRLSSQRALVIEEDAIGCVQPVGLSVVHRNPIGVDLGGGVGRPGVEGRRLPLRGSAGAAKHLRRRSLIEAGAFSHVEYANGFEEAQRSQSIRIGRVFGGLKAHLNMALRPEIVDLRRLDCLQQTEEIGGVGEITVMKKMRVAVEVIDAAGVE